MGLFGKPPVTRGPAIDRRMVLRAGVFGLAAAPAPLLAAQFDTARGFTHNVASGEPGADSVLLWTRFRGDEAPVTLRFEVCEKDDFAKIASGGEVVASPDRDWCAKANATGLAPGTWYYYRFVSPDGVYSPLGRTRTLPVGETASWKMAVFSCSNLRFGWFNAYAHAAQEDGFDCTLHLGDYFYEYDVDNYPNQQQAVAGRTIWPDHEIVALADYRLRYASYRADPDLQRVHQLWPMISGWDDHESANDSWAGGAQNHQPDAEGEWSVRKAAAMRAYREWMPVSDDPWATYEVGNLATLFRLETRLTARAEQFSLSALTSGAANAEAAIASLDAFLSGDYADPAREMLGAAQQTWLADGLRASARSGRPWQVLVQQVLMGNLKAPNGLADNLPADVPDYVRRRVQSGALAGRAELPLNMDAWDGYPAARQRVFEASLAADANLVSLAGDTHNAWAFELDLAGERVGVEFGGQSVTSPGIESSLPQLAPDTMARLSVETNSQLAWMDSSRRGYMAVELTPQAATCEYRFMDTVRQRSTKLAGTHRMVAPAGSRNFAA